MVILFFLELGFLPLSQFQAVDYSEYLYNDNALYVHFDIELEYEAFFIGGYNKSYFYNMIRTPYFYPDRSEFMVKTGFRFDKLEVGFRHYCVHPLVPYMKRYPKINYEGAYEEIYIRIGNVNTN